MTLQGKFIDTVHIIWKNLNTKEGMSQKVLNWTLAS